MVRIDPGRMNVLFTLQTLTATADGSGGTNTPVWTDSVSFWGELIQGGRGNSLRDTEQVSAYSYQINTYWMAQLDMYFERKRLVTDSGKTLYIENVQNVEEKNMYAVIYCGNER